MPHRKLPERQVRVREEAREVRGCDVEVVVFAERYRRSVFNPRRYTDGRYLYRRRVCAACRGNWFRTRVDPDETTAEEQTDAVLDDVAAELSDVAGLANRVMP